MTIDETIKDGQLCDINREDAKISAICGMGLEPKTT